MLDFGKAIFFPLVLLVLSSSSYTPNKQIVVPSSTFKMLYTNAQKYLMAASISQVNLYHGINGSKINTFNLSGRNDVSSIAVAPDNSQFAIGFNSGKIYVYSEGKFTGSQLTRTGTSKINSMCFTSDKKYLVIGMENQKIQVYSFQKKSSIIESFDNVRVFAVACSPVDQNSFVAGGGESTASKFTLFDFDFDTRNISNSLEFPSYKNGTVLDASFSKDGETIYRVGGSGNVSIYTMTSSTKFQEKQINVKSNGTLFQVSVSNDQNIIATVNDTKAIIIYPNKNNLELVIDASIPTTARTVALAPTAQKLTVVGTSGTADILGQCPQNQYINTNNVCRPCNSQCSICQNSASNCYECISNYYLNKTSCLTCGTGCLQCNQPNNCLNCDASRNFIRNTDGNCKCEPKYYISSGQCKLCSQAIPGCVNCNSTSNCISCDTQKNWQLKTQFLTAKCVCKSGYYQNQQKQCQLCNIQNCLECSNATQCTKCVNTFYLDSGNCKLCSDVLIGCVNCSSASRCTSCNSTLNRVLSNGKCVCRDGYYDEQGLCLLCDIDHCIKCSDATTCTECNKAEHWQVNNKQCSCMSHYIEIENECVECSIGCSTCDTNLTCLECDVGQHFQRDPVEGQCLCQAGYYFNDIKETCEICSVGCIDCQQPSVCNECDSEGHFIMIKDEDRCQCLPTYYLSLRQCKLCSVALVGCINCDSASKCTTCNQTLNRVLSNGKCVCQDGYYDEQGLCLLCDIDHCIKCSDATTCTQCNETEHWQVNNKECSCMSHYIEIENECVECSIGCSKCDTNLTCLECDIGQHFSKEPVKGQCLCQPGYYFNNTKETCEACSVGCIDCQQPYVCNECDSEGHFIMIEGDDRCECQPSYFLREQICSLCGNFIQNCRNCETSTECTECRGETILSSDNSSCLCPTKTFIDEDFNCLDCPEQCAQCENAQKCTQCEQGYNFDVYNYKCNSPLGAGVITLIVVGSVAVVGAVGFGIFKFIISKPAAGGYERL